MNKIANKQAICEVLMEKAKEDRDVVVLCSDSRRIRTGYGGTESKGGCGK